ncbi:hypothetical protein MOE90_20690 [Bacillus spizizenii]|nr:hypothetical protein [Bacillus spizizenii]MCY9124884.1 hypothetical protein [Bacillus spizizenii]
MNNKNQKRNYNHNSKPKGNFQPKSESKTQRPKKRHVPKNPIQAQQSQQNKPRRRRVAVDRNVEVVVVSNVIGRFYYENPRMNQVIDLHHIGDEEYVTVGDLRTIINSSRKILEGFDLLLTEVIDRDYTLEDVLVFLGLDRKYDEYFSLNKGREGAPQVADVRDFLINTPVKAFEKIMETIDPKLRSKIIEIAVTLFKLKEFGDYNKMRIIETYVSDDLFDDAEETEVDQDIYV